MNPFTLRTGGHALGVGGFMAFLMIYATFTFGSVSGAHAATNESVSVDDHLTALDGVEANATEKVHENVSGAGSIALVYIDPLIDASFGAAKAGVRWGYRHPDAALAFGMIADETMVALVAAYIGWILWRAGVISMLRRWRFLG